MSNTQDPLERMRVFVWLALAYLTANYLIYPSIAKGISVGLIFTFMIISRERDND